MDSTSLEGSPNTVQNSENSQLRHSPSIDPTKNLNNHFESVANQKYDSISELNKRGSMPSILHHSHLDHDDIFIGEDEDFVFEVESPKLSNKMQMILQSNVNLSESIIQNTFKAVDASRIKLEDRDLQVELEITELKLHNLEKKLEGCLQSSKSTLSMNAKLAENVSKILHSPSKRASTMNLAEIKPRGSDSKRSPKTTSNENGNGSQFFRSAQGINSSSPQTSNRPPLSGKKQVTEEVPTSVSVNVFERPQSQAQPLQTKSQNEGGIEARTITGTSIENNLKRNSTDATPHLETYLDNLKNSPYYFTFNQNQAKLAEELAKNMSADALQASIVDEGELLQNARNISETKKMALPGLNFNSLPHNTLNQQELPPPYKAPPENNNYINTQDNVSLDYSEITATNIQPPSEVRHVKQDQQHQEDVFSQLISQGPHRKQEIILEDANKNQMVYILKPKETLSFEKLETINIFFQTPTSQISDHTNAKVTLNVPPPTIKHHHHIPGVESEVESLLTTENIITQSSPAKVKLSVIRESETGHNTSYSESQPAPETQQLDESTQAMNLKLQLLNHPRCQKLLYGDDQYTVSNRGCSILQNRLESLDSGKKIISNRSDAYFKQKVHDFKNFLKEFEEMLGSETIIPGMTQGSLQSSPQQPIKRLNSCDSERLNSGEAKMLENILEKYFSSPQKQTHRDENPIEQEPQQEQIVSPETVIQPTKEKKLKKKRSLDKKPKATTKQPKVILNTSNLSNMTNSIKESGSVAQSPAQKFQSPLDKILAGSSNLTFKHIDMIANPIKLGGGVSSVKSDSHIQFDSTMKETRKNSEVSTHIAENEVRSPMGAMVDYAQFSKLAKNPRSVSFASGKSSSMKTLPEAQEFAQPTKLTKTKATTSKNKLSGKSSPKKSTSKPRSSSKTNKKAASTSNPKELDVLALLKPTGKKAKF